MSRVFLNEGRIRRLNLFNTIAYMYARFSTFNYARYGYGFRICLQEITINFKKIAIAWLYNWLHSLAWSMFTKLLTI